MSGTRTAPGRNRQLARRLAYRARAASWTALCALGALLSTGPAPDAETGPLPGTADG
ncbi:hypothetical protein [Kitasatospora phosalacinea]|uniref:hypothetical protein n=1 Tax=Kitasatospora phosalacinea TaxID=2065 RepID=UPI000AB82AF5|nr:hypothetical protein [Kitasatospora phosalacinea]